MTRKLFIDFFICCFLVIIVTTARLEPAEAYCIHLINPKPSEDKGFLGERHRGWGTERPGGRVVGQTISGEQSMSRVYKEDKAKCKAVQEDGLEREPETSGGLPAAGVDHTGQGSIVSQAAS